MRIPGLDNVHLTYCLNVHPGGTLEEAQVALFHHAREVFDRFRRATGTPPPYGVGLWLSAEAASTAVAEHKLDRLARGLAADRFYVFTLNGFPYGRFHGTRVKEAVYRPDWANADRVEYTNLLAYILGRLLPEGVSGTISTLPVTFKPWADADRITQAAENLAGIAVFLDDMSRTSGTDILLALEPEPGCFLERTADVCAFFEDELIPVGCQMMHDNHGMSAKLAEDIIRRHIGVCLDTVHTGVMRENPVDAVLQLADAGIRLGKVQLGAALRTTVGPDGPPKALDPFQDEVYLHQVTAQTADGAAFFVDLPDAYAHAADAVGDWRVHFHVPLSWEGEGDLTTTRDDVDEAFLRAAIDAGCQHFELEIYTLDVFPAATESIEAIMAQDLAWLWQRFQALSG